jgi:hypothetical protein
MVVNKAQPIGLSVSTLSWTLMKRMPRVEFLESHQEVARAAGEAFEFSKPECSRSRGSAPPPSAHSAAVGLRLA